MSVSRRKRPLVLLMPLSAENVSTVFDACLYKNVVATSDFRIMRVFQSQMPVALNQTTVRQSRVDILEMLMGVNPAVYGVGVRSRDMLTTRSGECWTTSFDLVEKLVMLGVAAGYLKLVQAQLPGDNWPVLQPACRELMEV